MNRILAFTIILLTCSLTLQVLSQEMILNDNYFMNSLYNLNPAAAGYKGGFTSTASVSHNWFGVDNAPSTQIISNNIRFGHEEFYDDRGLISNPIIDFAPRVGMGLSLYNEVSGPLRVSGLLWAYAYHIPLRKRSHFSWGLSARYSQFNTNTSLFSPINSNDPILYDDIQGGKPSFQVGAMYYNKDYILSLSVLQDININEHYQSASTSYVNLYALYLFPINYTYKLEGSLMADYAVNGKITSDLNIRLHYFGGFWLLIAQRNFSSISTGIGLPIAQYIDLQYQYRIGFSDFSQYSYGSHCISMKFNLEKMIKDRR